MGGFSGSVPSPTLARVKQLVATGQLKFFLLGGAGGFGGPGRGGRRRHGDAGRQLGGVRVCRRPGRGLRSHLGCQR